MRGVVDTEFLESCEKRRWALYEEFDGDEQDVLEQLSKSMDALNNEVQNAVFLASSLTDVPNGRDLFNFLWSRAEDEVEIGVVGTFTDAYNEFTFLEEILLTSMKIMER